MLKWSDAQALINEARNLRYKGNQWERDLMSRLEAIQPDELRPEDERNLIKLYRRAAGGESYQRG